MKGISTAIKNEAIEQTSGFLSMLIRTLAASSYIRKHINRKKSNKSSWGSNKSKSKFLMPHHPLTDFEIQKYLNEPKFNGVYSRNLYLNKVWGKYNKSDWLWINQNSFDSIICECWKHNILW